jgi:hypothetical protein
MKTIIKLTLLAAAAATLLAVPASAKTSPRHVLHRFQYNLAPVFQNDTVIEDGRYLGRDPDPNVRAELRRDDGAYNGND